MNRYLIAAILAALLFAATAPASAQIRYRAYYAPYGGYPYAPTYGSGYYAGPGYVYSPSTYYPYTSYYYSYPSGYAWGYPRTYGGYYGSYRIAPRYAYYPW